MKKTLIALLLIVATISQAHAYGFQANARVYMSQTQGTVEVINNLYQPIVCNGRVDGVTMNGMVLNAFMNNVVIYPGQFANIYIYTNNYNTFRQVAPMITCRTL